MKNPKYKVVLVDDNNDFKEAIKANFSFRHDIEVIGEAFDGIQFLDLLKTCAPDIVLMDINMPNMDGIVATKKGLIEDRSIKIIGVTMADNTDIHLDMLHFGFAGGILKNQFTDQFDKALEAISQGEVYFPLLN
ncbi:MAG: response regulator transcription factor [Prolixibacteraceae bacterium]|nr:response regulator transcription factor [Prolixibacteraceae bacterium]